ncbi:MAG: AAA family ATPase, partial [Clostridia bacterium]|nr:AAA family ATPase [Clostridia bacterium]
MRLKSLETYGFKSFADKFKLDFSDGVTCIVGPNGCGKSNVSDAIRWVLGEQNSKELRVGKGNKMEQVIFKGTEGKYGRSPMTYCEVVLTFDNTDRTLNIDTDEVSISRKMFKTGISEYCINGKKEKLKLIVDLFRNTGIGKDGYSVIGQGKIDNLLFAKPDELRLTFEEAAGISKLRQNRKDSLNKLEEASNDLNVVEEKLHVLENVIEPLKKQAETAQKAAVFKAKIKQLDINHFIYLTDSSVEQINKHEEKLKKINEKLANIEIEKSEVKTEYDQKQDRIKAIDVEYTEAYESLVKLTKDLGLQSTKQKELEKDIADGKNSNEEKQNKINTLSADATNKTKTVEEKNELMQEKIKDGLIAQNDLANLKQEFNTVSSDLKAKREKYDLTNNLILQNVQNSASITSDVATLNTEILLLEKNINDNKETIKNNNAKKKDEEKLMNEASLKYDETEERKNKYKTEKEEIQKQYFNKLETKQVAEINNSRLVQEISKLVGLINYKTDMLNSFGGFDYGVRQLMNEKDPAVKSRVYGVIGRLISVKPEYALAIETALGGNINNIVTESYADANFLIDYLKNTSGGGRATFMPLSEIVPKELEEMYDDVFDEPGVVGLCADLVRVENKYRKAIDSLLGKVVAVTTKEVAAQIAKKYRKGFRIVTLDGENFAVTGFVTGGKASGKGDSVLTLEAEINKNREELEKNKKEKELIDKELNLINGELKKLEE